MDNTQKCGCLNDMSFSYSGKEYFSMENLNLKIVAGKTTALVGPSGSGKSTIADLVMGLIKPNNGETTVDGIPISNYYEMHGETRLAT